MAGMSQNLRLADIERVLTGSAIAFEVSSTKAYATSGRATPPRPGMRSPS
jgi:hypothetical protein